MSRRRNRLPKVIPRRINKRRATYGIYDDELHEIYLEPRYPQREQFKTLIHELIHVALGPDVKEREVIRITNKIFPVLWKQGYRKVVL
jgi:Zn-dependent peptidase ImmA (M78 family)